MFTVKPLAAGILPLVGNSVRRVKHVAMIMENCELWAIIAVKEMVAALTKVVNEIVAMTQVPAVVLVVSTVARKRRRMDQAATLIIMPEMSGVKALVIVERVRPSKNARN